MGERAFQLVDWDLHGKALSMVAAKYRPGVQKMIWGEYPCSEKLCQDGRITDNKCPLCGEVNTRGHFLQCAAVKKGKNGGG